jgi:shikimate dehydrogenase
MNPSHHPLSLGLIGYPLGHSLSPKLHAAALHSVGLQGQYRLYPVPPVPEGLPVLEALLDLLRMGGLHGLNVTIPHKQNVIPFVDELTPLAQAIGAVNTVFRRGGRLVGDNTDAPGFLADLERHAPGLQPGTALILGSGGGARAVVFALAQAGWNVTLAPARVEDEGQAQSLAADIQKSAIGNQKSKIAALPYRPQQLGYISPSLLVNCTPLGMHPNHEASPWPEGAALPSGAVVYDLVYNPAVTKFTAVARASGLIAANGLGMLIAQAALAFERWTGLKPSIEAMQEAVA